jgi:hypothetical protein
LPDGNYLKKHNANIKHPIDQISILFVKFVFLISRVSGAEYKTVPIECISLLFNSVLRNPKSIILISNYYILLSAIFINY